MLIHQSPRSSPKWFASPPKARSSFSPFPSEPEEEEDLYETENRTIFLIGQLKESTVYPAIKQLFALSSRSALEPIKLVISTHGGDVDDAFALYDAMQICRAPVHTVGLGKVMSAGCLLLAAGSPGHRSMGVNARLMYHGGWEICDGDVFEQENNTKEFRRQEQQFNALVARCCGVTVKDVRALYLPKRLDKYMSAKQCIKFGFADSLLG